MSRAITLGDLRCLSLSSAASSHRLDDKNAAFVRISLGFKLPLASTTARLSKESLGASLQNFHEVLVASFISKIGKGSDDLVGVSAGVTVPGAGVRTSGSWDCFSLSGDGADLACCCFSNSPDTSGESMLFSDSGVESTAWKFCRSQFPSIFWATKQTTENVLNRENEKTYRRWRKAFGGVEAFPGEKLVAVEDLKEPSHATHLLFQILVLYNPCRHFPGKYLTFPFLFFLLTLSVSLTLSLQTLSKTSHSSEASPPTFLSLSLSHSLSMALTETPAFLVFLKRKLLGKYNALIF
jgi:hypothetical protein